MSTNSQQLLADTLRSAGYSLTKPRLALFAALIGQAPLTLRQLSERTHPRVERTSLYRTLMLFEKLGIVQRVSVGWKDLFELSGQFIHHHHHITCAACGTITMLPEDSALESLLNELAHQHAYIPLRHQLEIQGYCPNCQANEKGETANPSPPG